MTHKLLAVAILILSLLITPASAKAPGAAVVKTELNADGSASLTVRNETGKALWLYLECWNALTVAPVGVTGARYSIVQLSASDRIELPCTINHYLRQGEEPPKPWRP